MAELPKATFDGSTLTIGADQTVPQGPYKTRVGAALVYENTSRMNEFIAAVPGRYWFELPPSINKRNTTQIKSYVSSVLSAPTPVQAPTNTDDSYSLRDIYDFKSNVATMTITGNHDWVDENTVKLATNTVLEFRPNEGWAATFDLDGESMTVTTGQNLTTSGRSADDNLVTMEALQFVAQDGSFEVYRGDFKTSTTSDPIAYYGAFQMGERQVVESFSNEFGSVQLVKMPDNVVSSTEGEYLVFRGEGDDQRRIGRVDTSDMSFVPFTGLEEAQEFYNGIVESLTASETLAQEQAAAQAEADLESARAGTVIGSDSRGSRSYVIKYLGDDKYAILLESQGGLMVATFTASSDEEALVMAPAKIDAYEAATFARSDVNWGVIVAAVVGVGAIMGLIIWLRMRKEA
tara:strand:- start:3380 stop:4594 length:1215 start_codon:yes stop_codon:yes gene_type:complete